MKAVGNIGKITKAMKMVASSKMRADIFRLNSGKDFGVHMMPKVFDLDTYSKSKTESFDPQKILMIPITTDRGLCGGINSNTLRAMKEVVLQNRNKYKILCIGEKGTSALARPFPDLLIQAVTELHTPINFYNVSSLTGYILKSQPDFDEYHILYNRFINTIQYKPEILKIMSKDQFAKRFNRLCTYDVSEPDSDVSLPYFYELYVGSSFYFAMLQNAACE